MQYMGAVLIAKAKEVRSDGSIIEIVVWELPDPLPASIHRFKYRLYYGVGGGAGFATTTNAEKGTTATLVNMKKRTNSRRSRGG